jgi:hypothetical protein
MAVSDAFPFVPQHAILELVLHPPPEKPMGHSVLYKLPELLLGRPRVYTPTTVPEPQPTPKAHLLRTESYKQHVQALLLQTFPMLSKSQIRAVGLEVNWEYRAANEACGEIVRRLGWAGRMFGGLRALARTKTRVELEGCPELIEELWEAEKAVRDEAERRDTEAAIVSVLASAALMGRNTTGNNISWKGRRSNVSVALTTLRLRTVQLVPVAALCATPVSTRKVSGDSLVDADRSVLVVADDPHSR